MLSQEEVKFTKRIVKMGDRATYPNKGDTVECYYTGRLDSGKVFDTNVDDSMSTSSCHYCWLSVEYITGS